MGILEVEIVSSTARLQCSSNSVSYYRINCNRINWYRKSNVIVQHINENTAIVGIPMLNESSHQ
jgi:hypothetical protein